MAIGLMLFGGGVIGLGVKGFGEAGIPLGVASIHLRGRPGKLVGILLMWLGMGIFGATAAWLLTIG
ncbi:MAG: hypothetical protein WKF75_08705 [Singulisphaera sp.]